MTTEAGERETTIEEEMNTALNESEEEAPKEGTEEGQDETTEKESSEEDSEDEELNARVSKLAQALKDKELKPVYQENRNLKKQLKDLELKIQHVQEDKELSTLEKLEREEHGETREVKTLQDARQEVIKMGRDNLAERTRLESLAEELNTEKRESSALVMALEVLLPDNSEDFIAEVNAFAERFKEAETPREQELLKQLAKNERASNGDKPLRKGTKRSTQTKVPNTPSSSLKGDAVLLEGIMESEKKQRK
jgi:site-specific DNA-cytosine methylase